MVQPPRDLEGVPGVLVQIVAGVHDDPLLRDAERHGPVDGAPQVVADLRDDVAVGRPGDHGPGSAHVGEGVGDHEVRARGGHHPAQVRVEQSRGVVDDVRPRGQGRLGHGRLERVRREDQPARCLGRPGPVPAPQGRDQGDHPRRLLGRVELRPGRERHAADVDPLGSGVRRGVGLGEGVLQDGAGAVVVEGVRGAVDHGHRDDPAAEVDLVVGEPVHRVDEGDGGGRHPAIQPPAPHGDSAPRKDYVSLP